MKRIISITTALSLTLIILSTDSSVSEFVFHEVYQSEINYETEINIGEFDYYKRQFTKKNARTHNPKNKAYQNLFLNKLGKVNTKAAFLKNGYFIINCALLI